MKKKEDQFVTERQMENFRAAAEQYQCEWDEVRLIRL
jgi:hypothetical protein